jgi:hypothetical protein
MCGNATTRVLSLYYHCVSPCTVMSLHGRWPWKRQLNRSYHYDVTSPAMTLKRAAKLIPSQYVTTSAMALKRAAKLIRLQYVTTRAMALKRTAKLPIVETVEVGSNGGWSRATWGGLVALIRDEQVALQFTACWAAESCRSLAELCEVKSWLVVTGN